MKLRIHRQICCVHGFKMENWVKLLDRVVVIVQVPMEIFFILSFQTLNWKVRYPINVLLEQIVQQIKNNFGQM